MAEPDVNGLATIAVKEEPADPLLEAELPIIPVIPSVIPKEYTVNGIHDDSDCEDISHFTQLELDNTRKCLENTRLIIKDFETQLDWHLQQYMTLRNVFDPKRPKGPKDETSKRQDLLSISQLSAIIANHPEGNKKFIKRKGPMSNGLGGRKRRKNKDSDSEEEDSEYSDEDSEEEDYEDEYTGEEDSEDIDDPGKKGKKGRGKRGRSSPEVKDEIVEEEHELIEPKQEMPSEDEMMEEDEDDPPTPPPPKKTPAKRGRKPASEAKTPAKRGRGKKNQGETVDLTNLKKCKVVLNRVDDTKDGVEIKDEDIDRDELIELLQSKAITELDNFDIDSEKPIAILRNDNVKTFDFNECKTSNVIITFEDMDSFPEFIFVKQVADHILEDTIKLVDADVFDQHLSEEK